MTNTSGQISGRFKGLAKITKGLKIARDLVQPAACQACMRTLRRLAKDCESSPPVKETSLSINRVRHNTNLPAIDITNEPTNQRTLAVGY